MGRQICFFATAKDYYILFDHIVNKGWVFIDRCGENISLERVKQMVQDNYDNNSSCLMVYITKKDFNIKYKYLDSNETFIKTIESEVIEISICCPPARNIKGLVVAPNQYEHGRLWYERQYYDKNANMVIKSKELDKMFDSLARKVRANGIISETEFAYILPDAYKLYKEGRFIPCSGRNKINFN